MSADTGDVVSQAPEVPPSSGKRRGLGRRAGGTLAVQGGGTVVKYASQALLARLLGVDRFGTYTYALNLGQLLATPSDLGASSAALRFVPEYEATGRADLLAGVLRALHLAPVIFGMIVCAGAVGVIALVGGGPVPTGLALLAMVVIPLTVALNVETSVTRGFHRVVAAYLPSLIFQPVLAAMGVVAIYFANHHHVTAMQAMTVTIISLVLAVAAQAWILHTSPRRTAPAPPAYAPREWLAVSTPLMLSTIVQQALQRVDVLMVGLLLGAPEAGIYAIAFRTAGLTSMFQTAMNATMAPRISELYWSERHDELEENFLAAVRLVLLPSIAISAGLFLFGRPALGLFGHAFEAGWSALVVYSLGQLVSASCGPVGWLLSLTGHQRTAAGMNAVSAVIALVGYLVLIPHLGMVGAATANTIAVAVNNIWELIYVRRRIGLRVSPLRALRPT